MAVHPSDPSHVDEYVYPNAAPRWDDRQVFRAAGRAIARVAPAPARIFELGCGNGTTASRLRALGFEVTAVDPSPSGISAAQAAHPGIGFHVASADDALASRFGRFPVVLSLEV